MTTMRGSSGLKQPGLALDLARPPTTKVSACPAVSRLSGLTGFPCTQVYIDEKGNVFPGQGPTGKK